MLLKYYIQINFYTCLYSIVSMFRTKFPYQPSPHHDVKAPEKASVIPQSP